MRRDEPTMMRNRPRKSNVLRSSANVWFLGLLSLRYSRRRMKATPAVGRLM
jgi:hypothetical protein